MTDQNYSDAGFDCGSDGESAHHWDYPAPHIVSLVVGEDVIDRMDHANNTAYVQWFELAAWSHTEALGLGWDAYTRLNRGFVARHTEVDYLRPALKGDALRIATWVVFNDQRLSMERHYQIVRDSDGATLARGSTQWVCVALDTGKPRRMPQEFIDIYPSEDIRRERGAG
ncbi:acyl-CoA thioesterase [Alcanivorax sp. JB21]|uniref:acyl-CoA thioesterase n=1 Tax=Alcanivorax limicola TaxID=2874102 RepID=UPI001CBAA995|nr:thioesterase family protein [Alcanivorax limicola]MBZ2189865.1 acyl-CoA thioesterase [Alcanivorax limicola]